MRHFRCSHRQSILEPGYAHTLTFKLYYRNRATVFATPSNFVPLGSNQQYRVDIIRVNALIDSLAPSDVLTNLFRTRVGDPNDLPPTTISADLTAFAGFTVRLRFAVVETLQFFNASVDDVKLVSTPRQCLSMQCPADVQAVAEDGQCSAIVNFAAPVPVSACPGVTASVVCVPPSGSRFAVGSTEVKCTASDGSGNTMTCSFNVVVTDAEAPKITVSEAS